MQPKVILGLNEAGKADSDGGDEENRSILSRIMVLISG